MDTQIQQLASTIISRSEIVLKTQPRFLVAIAGRPGSGKSTVAKRLSKSINHNKKLNVGSEEPAAIVIGLDGWHYPRSVLDQFEDRFDAYGSPAHGQDPAEAHRRRGAPHTFDAPGYLAFVESLLATPCPPPAPVFSHAAKDPVPDALVLGATQSIVILEGLYTLLDDGSVWASAARLVHLAVLVDASPEAAQRRLVERHVRAGICPDAQQAAMRVEFNDHPNGEYLLKHIRAPDIVIKSIDDETMRTEDRP